MSTVTSHTESTRGQLGQGLYGLGELRAYLSLQGGPEDGQRVPRWLSEALNPVIRTPRRPDHSFADLISLFVVSELVRLGVPLRRIREGEAHLREIWQTDRPFLRDSIETDGHHVYADGAQASGQREAASGRRGQQVMLETIKDLLTSVRYGDGRALTWAPAEHVVLDPRVQFGEPIISGTRVLTELVAQQAAAFDPTVAAARYRISPEQAMAALAFERRLAAARN